jgi:alpha-1,2-mannosyltransferase
VDGENGAQNEGGEGFEASAASHPPTTLHPLQISLLNFIRYNVAGGGDSALYGVEPWSYYLFNSFLTTGPVLALALALPLALVAAGPRSPLRNVRRLLVATAAAPVWLAAVSALPHKEERFLYPIYPLLTAAAGATLACVPGAITRLAPRFLRRPAAAAARAAPVAAVAVAALLGLSRTAALLHNYGAPMTIYSALPPVAPGAGRSLVCLGGEWHRFPSSFLLPSPAHAPAFVASGFKGLLPVPFNASSGGTAAAPATLNDRNEWAPSHELPDAARCAFFVGLAPPAGDAPAPGREWATLAEAPFVDTGATRGGPLRAFYVPRLSRAHAPPSRYVLMQRVAPPGSGSARLAAAGGPAS